MYDLDESLRIQQEEIDEVSEKVLFMALWLLEMGWFWVVPRVLG